MPSDRYIGFHDAAVCPLCRSPEISSENVDADGSCGCANVYCHKCGSQWTDIWVVTGYGNFNEGMTAEQLKEIQEKATKILNS